MTLVALLAVTTGAWAQGPWTSGDCTVTFSEGVMTVSGTGAMANYEVYETPWNYYCNDVKTIIIENGVTSIGNNAFGSCTYLESVSIPASVTSIGYYAFENCGSDVDALTVSFAEGSTPLTISGSAFNKANLKSIDIPNRVTSIGFVAFQYCRKLESVSIPASMTSISEQAFEGCEMLANVYIYAPSLTTYGANAFASNATGRKIYVLTDAVDTYKAGWPDYAADIVGDLQPLASGPEVAWDKAKKTGTFTMPGGNVTLEPEYYAQATVADGGVTAADADARATTDDPLVKVDATKLTGAKKLMYFVSNSGTTAPAYDAEGWTDQLPTAEGFTQQGIVYVWYYPVGIDEGVDGATATYSDGDICLQSITARIAPEPTYAVTFAEGTDPNEWTASPNAGVTKGTPVTVTYTGSKKVLGVKAEKKAAAPTLAETLTTADMTVSVSFLVKGNAETVNFTSNGDGTYTKTGGTGTTATAPDWTIQLVENNGLIVFKAHESDNGENSDEAFKFNFFPSDNTYYMWRGSQAQYDFEVTFTSISVNGTAIAVTEAQDS